MGEFDFALIVFEMDIDRSSLGRSRARVEGDGGEIEGAFAGGTALGVDSTSGTSLRGAAEKCGVASTNTGK